MLNINLVENGGWTWYRATRAIGMGWKFLRGRIEVLGVRLDWGTEKGRFWQVINICVLQKILPIIK